MCTVISENSPQQTRFWNEFKRLRGQIEFMYLYAHYCERWDTAIKMFLAVASVGSIAGWAVWQKYAQIWAVIIAGSQVVTAIRRYLPFERRQKLCSQIAPKLEGLFQQWESTYQDVAAGKVAEEDIASRIAQLNQAKLKLVGYFPVPKKRSIVKHAEEEADAYLRLIYAIGG